MLSVIVHVEATVTRRIPTERPPEVFEVTVVDGHGRSHVFVERRPMFDAHAAVGPEAELPFTILLPVQLLSCSDEGSRITLLGVASGELVMRQEQIIVLPSSA